jgi:hypothetical protein
MKTFSDLLATDAGLVVKITHPTGMGEILYLGLDDIIELKVGTDVTINDYEILPKYQYLAQDGVLIISAPFYSWLHNHSGQGWLLNPS